MPYPQRRGTFPSSSPRQTGPVLSVGQQVFVNCPNRSTAVVLTDDAGRNTNFRLVDGAAVEVLAWRPRGSGGTRYRVVAARTREEGWLPADQLRSAAVPPPPAPPAPPQKPVDEGRRFGQRANGR